MYLLLVPVKQFIKHTLLDNFALITLHVKMKTRRHRTRTYWSVAGAFTWNVNMSLFKCVTDFCSIRNRTIGQNLPNWTQINAKIQILNADVFTALPNEESRFFFGTKSTETSGIVILDFIGWFLAILCSFFSRRASIGLASKFCQ